MNTPPRQYMTYQFVYLPLPPDAKPGDDNPVRQVNAPPGFRLHSWQLIAPGSVIIPGKPAPKNSQVLAVFEAMMVAPPEHPAPNVLAEPPQQAPQEVE